MALSVDDCVHSTEIAAFFQVALYGTHAFYFHNRMADHADGKDRSVKWKAIEGLLCLS